MKIIGEQSAKSNRMPIGVAAGLLAVGALVTGCGSSEQATDKPVIATVWTPNPAAKLQFDGEVNYNGSAWPINCFAEEMIQEKAEPGDTLLSLAHKANTQLVDPSSVNLHRIPPAAFAVALAHLNKLENPDFIQAGQTYQFPETCIAG